MDGTSLCILEVIRDSNLFHDFFLNSCDSHCGGQRHLGGLQQTLLREMVSNKIIINTKLKVESKGQQTLLRGSCN